VSPAVAIPSSYLQPEIEANATTTSTNAGSLAACREQFDMGWTSRASLSSPRRRTLEAAGLDEFSDPPPAFSDAGMLVELPAVTQPNSVDAAQPEPVIASAPSLVRSDDFRFWEQPLASPAAKTATGENPQPSTTAQTSFSASTQTSPGDPKPPEIPPASSKPLKDTETSKPALHAGDAARAADRAWSLLEIISLSNDSQPQERALAADALLNLLPKLSARVLMAIADRMSLMEAPPRLVVNQLVRDRRTEVAGPLLEKSAGVSDQDLAEVISGAAIESIRMIARRRTLSSALCSAVIDTGEPSVILTLVRNPGATISHAGFIRLNAVARQHVSLQAPLATRPDLPAPVAFELFWSLPVELRRYVLSRFLTDSKTLDRILKIAKSVVDDAVAEEPQPSNFPARERVDEFVALLVAGDSLNAAKLLSKLAGVRESNAARIIADSNGEPIAAALKAMGVPRARFEEIIQLCRLSPGCALRQDRKVEELQSLFDTLSFNKARVLLTYWDWAVAQTGPYELPSDGSAGASAANSRNASR
jgi:uncharacterized protein (DUF2336 family)